MKRITLIVLVAVVAIAAAVVAAKVFINPTSTDPFRAIPSDAAVVLEFHNPSEQMDQWRTSELWDRLQIFTLLLRAGDQLSFFDSLWFEANQKVHLLASLHKVKADDYGLLFSIDPQAKVKEDDLINKLGRPNRRNFKGNEILEFPNIYKDQTLAISLNEGLILASVHPFLVETALAQMESGSIPLSSDNKFQEVRKLAGKNQDPKVYLNLQALPTLLSVVLSDDYAPTAQGLSEFAGWLVVDYNFMDKSIFFNGYAYAEEGDWLRQLQPATAASATEVLPFNTAFFYTVRSGNIDQLVGENNAQVMFDEYFINWVGRAVTFAVTEPFSKNYRNNALVVIDAVDAELAERQLLALAEENFNESVTPELYKQHNIYPLGYFDGLEQSVGLRSSVIDTAYFSLIEDHVLLANSSAALKVVIERYTDQQTLANDVDFLAFKKQMTESYLVNFYLNTARVQQLLAAILNDQQAEFANVNFSTLQQITPLGLQISAFEEDKFLVSGIIQTTGGFQQRTNLLWKTQLDAPIAIRPEIVINHYTDEKEILVQDEANNLYLISNGGEILWKKPLDGRITGEIHLVDFYNNRKFQYLFATQNQIHVIDRNGDDVENYPLGLAAPTTSGISMFDYNNNNKFRLFLTTENGFIYGFEKSGKPLPGWSPKREGGPYHFAVLYTLAEGRDYLIASNPDGKVWLFNRRGDLRVPVIELNAKFHQNFNLIPKPTGFDLVNVSAEGILFRINETGAVGKDTLESVIGEARFLFSDIAGDANKEYILLGANKIAAFNQAGDKLFDYALPGEVSDFFAVEIGEKARIGFVSKAEEKIYLLNGSGILHEDFPLSGSTGFTLTDLYDRGESEVMVGSADGTLTVYRLK